MKSTVTTICICLLSFALCWSDGLPGEIIQYKNDRLYFDQGQESNLFGGSPFAVINGEDTIYASTIEFSYEGVSISQTCGGFFDSLSWQQFEVLLTPALFDSSAVLRIATDFDPDEFMSTGLLTQTQDSSAPIRYNSGIKWVRFEDRIEMLHDFQAGKSDCLVSFNDHSRQLASANIIWAPAPYVAVLIPNLSTEPNRGAALTTSLYYRFDSQRLGLYFDGDRTQPVHSFRAAWDLGNRMYEYDIDRGRQLFARVSGNPRRLNIYVGHPSLLRLADYFGDILARDRCRMTVVESREKADLYLEFVPLSLLSPANTMSFILDLVQTDCAGDESLQNILQSCRRQLQWSTSDPDSSRISYHLRLGNRMLINDLGVFPLFRPSVHVTSQPDIKGIGTNADGLIDFTTARRIAISPVRKEQP